MIAFGGLNWALDGAAAPVAAVARLKAAMGRAGQVTAGGQPAAGMPARQVAFRDVTFAYPASPDRPVLKGLSLEIPAGSALAIVGQNGAGKTTLAKLLCRLYDPQSGAIEVDGTDLRDLDLDGWRRQVTAVFQDFVRFELTLRENVAPRGDTGYGSHDRAELDAVIGDALAASGAAGLASLDTVLAKGYTGGTDLSGGQWQRIALARALYAAARGARVLVLDEPTAQLDIRAEAAFYSRFLELTAGLTTMVISHRFATVRRAERIAVLEAGRITELGSHQELIAAGGSYAEMFATQAARFASAGPGAAGRAEGSGEGGRRAR
jgi:ABC-type multidrug transport system fused ATPase/permease subunit